MKEKKQNTELNSEQNQQRAKSRKQTEYEAVMNSEQNQQRATKEKK